MKKALISTTTWLFPGTADYKAHLELADTVLPGSGGEVAVDGTWYQDPLRVDTAGALELKAVAQAAGHTYMPYVWANRATLPAILANPAIWPVAAANLVALATSGRFDSPWDAIIYDMIGVYSVAHYDFITTLSVAARAAGFLFGFAITGKLPGAAPGLLAMAAATCDIFIYYHYNYWDASPDYSYSMSPYWWCRASIENAMARGVSKDQIWLGLPNYATWYPVSGNPAFTEGTYAWGMQKITDAGGTISWVESGPDGLIREWRGTAGTGHVWFHDEHTLRPRLALVDEYALAGMMLFCGGYGSDASWDAIAEWKQPAAPPVSKPTDFFYRGASGEMTAQKLHGSGGLFSGG